MRRTGSQRKIPSLARTTIQPSSIEIRLVEKLVGSGGVYDRVVCEQNSLPSANNIIRSPVREIRVPLLSHKLLCSRQSAGGKERQHMDALDVRNVRAEVRRVVNLVLEENARDFVPDEVCRLVDVVARVEEVVLERAGSDGKLEVAAGFHVGVANGASPHFDRICVHGIFGGTFLVFPVEGFEQAVGPAVTVVPVEHSGYRKVVVFRGRIGNVADESVNVILIRLQPAGIQVTNYGSGIDEVSIMEVMIVVIGVPKVGESITGHVRDR